MPDITAVCTFVGKIALFELWKRARQQTSQGKFECENREQFDDLTAENSKHIQTLACRIEAQDKILAYQGNRIEGQLVEKLEYPHFRVLKSLLDGTYPGSVIRVEEEDVFFARTLKSLDLVREDRIDSDRIRFSPNPFAQRLIEFALPPKI